MTTTAVARPLQNPAPAIGLSTNGNSAAGAAASTAERWIQKRESGIARATAAPTIARLKPRAPSCLAAARALERAASAFAEASADRRSLGGGWSAERKHTSYSGRIAAMTIALSFENSATAVNAA